MNEDLLKELKSLVPCVIVAALAVGGYYGVKNYRAQRKAAAAHAVATADSVADLESAVADFGQADVGGVVRFRLAKRYFDEARYAEARDLYATLKGETVPGFEGVAEVGYAESLEALKDYAGARTAYEEFVAANAASPLALTARLGSLRAQALAGDRAQALENLKALKDSHAGEELALARIEQLEDLINRLGAAN